MKKKVKKAISKPNIKTKKVSVKNGEDITITTSHNPEIQDGIMPTNVKLKEKPPKGFATIGTAIGATINVGDYQSARIDVFIQRNVEDSAEAIRDGYREIGELLHEELQRQSAELLDE